MKLDFTKIIGAGLLAVSEIETATKDDGKVDMAEAAEIAIDVFTKVGFGVPEPEILKSLIGKLDTAFKDKKLEAMEILGILKLVCDKYGIVMNDKVIIGV